MTAPFIRPYPHLAPSPLQHYLLQKQQEISKTVGVGILLQVTAGYGATYEVVLLTWEGEEVKMRGDDLDEALQQATEAMWGMQQAKRDYEVYRAAQYKWLGY